MLVAVLTDALVGMTFLFCLGYYVTLFYYFKYRNCRSPASSGIFHALPTVTVQLPVFNERETVLRLLEAVTKMHGVTEIQVLDDSTDDTTTMISSFILKSTHTMPIRHIRRPHRHGYKAGALREATAGACGEFIAIFDSDFVPAPDFLKQVLPQFKTEVGCVQARWGYLNEDSNLLTLLQSIGIAGHFVIEQTARCNAGLFLNFNGTCGVWRKSCIEASGGWHSDTLAEDLDLSYRAQLGGWKILYDMDVVVPGELPVSFSSFKQQQQRWARGSVQVAKKLLPKIWNADIPLVKKFYATYHLSSYFICVLMCATMLIPLIAALCGVHRNHAWMCTISIMGPPLMYITSLAELRKLKQVCYLPLLLLVGYGIAANNAIAVMRGLFDASGCSGEFLRTPKIGAETGKTRVNLTASLRTVSCAYVELAVLIYLVVALWLLGATQRETSVLFGVFVLAYSLATGLGIFDCEIISK